MNLTDDFYKITQRTNGDSGFEYILSLNKEHPIYQAHFPGNPITPGVCIIQFCKELMEHHTGEKLFLRKIVNVKFLSVINPQENAVVRVAFSKLSAVDKGYTCSVLVYSENLRFAKLSLFLERIPGVSLPAAEMRQLGICVVIPTYNNAPFLPVVLDEVLQYTASVIVVNDGSTDSTHACLEPYRSRITLVSYPQNKGKGYALSRGFDQAEALGYPYAITMDSDGQHTAADLPLFVEAIKKYPGSMIIGSRELRQKHMPSANTFANVFSNFWFTVQTGTRLPDTQTGFRLYPLGKMKGMRAFTPKYEAELELLVRSAWRNIRQIPIRIRVAYPPAGERVTHFRPGMDFLRISLLNTALVPVAFLYGYPSRFIRSITKSR
ncbi:MAG: glycosyltransferase [Tannerellaceae bacterium]|jgi:3-hydroxymyristoyl/3-hydroxydecanoyl-(acyl carrier protein) dehydratase|nr:glycosyltransferase [Tannerellaceae bacterium]